MSKKDARFPPELVTLAERVLATTDKPERPTTGIYYMLGVNHPVIAELRQRFCQKYNINTHMPMSDIERTVFELMLFRPDVLQMISNGLPSPEKQKERSEPKHIENGIKKD